MYQGHSEAEAFFTLQLEWCRLYQSNKFQFVIFYSNQNWFDWFDIVLSYLGLLLNTKKQNIIDYVHWYVCILYTECAFFTEKWSIFSVSLCMWKLQVWKTELGLVGLKKTVKMGNPLQLSARKCREFCFSFCNVCSKEFPYSGKRKKAFLQKKVDPVHSQWLLYST